jgi:hypothetical protein
MQERHRPVLVQLLVEVMVQVLTPALVMGGPVRIVEVEVMVLGVLVGRLVGISRWISWNEESMR